MFENHKYSFERINDLGKMFKVSFDNQFINIANGENN